MKPPSVKLFAFAGANYHSDAWRVLLQGSNAAQVKLGDVLVTSSTIGSMQASSIAKRENCV